MRNLIAAVLIVLTGVTGFAQNFEAPKLDASKFEKVKAKVGGDFAIQYQALNHSINGSSDSLIDLKHNINLPTANFNITTDLGPGVQLYMNTFLSSRHHNDAWVEGGYLTIDNLPFLPAADPVMKYLTIKAGVFNPNYGDAHFYRSTNAHVVDNPFVGNWIMDSYTTNPGMEIMYRNNGVLAMVGTNNGRMNYGRGNDLGKDLVFLWKLAYDKQFTDDFRGRVSLSGYHVPEGHSGSTLWGGDRSGARYYNVMQWTGLNDNFRSGRWDPGSEQTQMNSYQANIFAKFKGLEVFGIFEDMKGVRYTLNQHFTQTAVQAIYRLGDFYLGTRWNNVSDNNGSTVTRLNLGGGWNMLDNVLVKVDYVNQKYSGPAKHVVGQDKNNSYIAQSLDGGKFNGVVVEAAISF
ncbi:hypothetical protein ACE01N_04025 [Saccharicrinis sp. FJH2]|uniref:hypothetical protein n=1 Tax=Saccharicrinis sp. FJH65 TaxID=3344659 RepID=UPI0035F4E8D9